MDLEIRLAFGVPWKQALWGVLQFSCETKQSGGNRMLAEMRWVAGGKPATEVFFSYEGDRL